MSKEELKRMIVESQEGFCALSNEPLDSDSSLIDTDRILPKSNSGIYTFENTRIVEPVATLYLSRTNTDS
jgi:hypothetical protein